VGVAQFGVNHIKYLCLDVCCDVFCLYYVYGAHVMHEWLSKMNLLDVVMLL
jgi:hypothetical protein